MPAWLFDNLNLFFLAVMLGLLSPELLRHKSRKLRVNCVNFENRGDRKRLHLISKRQV